MAQQELLQAVTLRRVDGWPERLDAYVASVRSRPFDWSENNCAKFAAGAVFAVTGEMLYRCTNHADLVRELRKHRGLQAAVSHYLPVVEVEFARRGDLLLMRNDDRRWLAVCLGAYAAGPGASGVAFAPALDAVVAWKVG
jgi:hypothetical protein